MPPERTALDDEIAARIRRFGPLPFAQVMEAALYDPTRGFYLTGGAAGRRGDFITSAEVGPLFGAVLARALDEWWHDLGEPDPYVVVEAGAGVGTLARSILAAEPACLPSLVYVLVETSDVLRARQGDHLPLVDAAWALPPSGERLAGERPAFVSVADLPVGPLTGVLLANELLDNLPVDLLERRAGAWHEIHVALAPDDVTLVELAVPAPASLAAQAERYAPAAGDGARIPLATAATRWTMRARGILDAGFVALVDYGDDTASLARRAATEWLRTYRGQEHGGNPLEALGTQDITCEIPLDQVEHALGAGAARTRQADFLRSHGIDELVEEGRRIWHERAHIGDLTAIKARSRVREAEALLDPDGLGAFWFLTARIG